MPDTRTAAPPLAPPAARDDAHALYWLLAACAVHLLLWGAMSARWAPASPDDSLEQVLLSQEWRIEYGKHPPLPTWLLAAVARVFGPSIGATFVLGALCAVVTMALLYGFAQPLVGAARAAVAAMLAGCVVYLNAGTAYYNHNTVQIPLATLAIVLFHRALTRRRALDWVLFGLGCGLMMLAKFSAVILFASFGIYLLWSGRWRDAALWRGLALALVACAAVVAPIQLSAPVDDVAPGAYANEAIFPDDMTRLERLKSVYGFATSQLGKLAPALIAFLIVRRGAPRAVPRGDEPVPLAPFLTIVGFGPLVLTVVVAAVSGARLLVNWGASFHVLFTLWLVAAWPFAIEAPPAIVRRTLWVCVVMQAALWAVLTYNGGRLPNLNPTRHVVPLPMAPDLPETLRRAWAAHCSGPLRYVLTDVNTGSALAVRYGGAPRVVDGGRPERHRFFPDAARAGDGALVVVSPSAAGLQGPPLLEALYAQAASRTTIELPLADGRLRAYRIGIVAPTAAGAARCSD